MVTPPQQEGESHVESQGYEGAGCAARSSRQPPCQPAGSRLLGLADRGLLALILVES